MAAGIVLSAGGFYALSHWRYVPPQPLAIARRLIDLVQAGDLAEAYRPTAARGAVGGTLAAFEGNIRRQMGIGAFPTRRGVVMIGVTSGPQTYGHRLRRWLAGRKLDPDEVSVDYFVGLPFEIRLAFEPGGWRIVAFQSHAM